MILGERRAGGFVFRWWAGDHEPRHIHIYRDGRLLGRWDLVNQRPIDPFMVSRRLARALMIAGFVKDGE